MTGFGNDVSSGRASRERRENGIFADEPDGQAFHGSARSNDMPSVAATTMGTPTANAGLQFGADEALFLPVPWHAEPRGSSSLDWFSALRLALQGSPNFELASGASPFLGAAVRRRHRRLNLGNVHDPPDRLENLFALGPIRSRPEAR
jgi:hypothetical protein